MNVNLYEDVYFLKIIIILIIIILLLYGEAWRSYIMKFKAIRIFIHLYIKLCLDAHFEYYWHEELKIQPRVWASNKELNKCLGSVKLTC